MTTLGGTGAELQHSCKEIVPHQKRALDIARLSMAKMPFPAELEIPPGFQWPGYLSLWKCNPSTQRNVVFLPNRENFSLQCIKTLQKSRNQTKCQDTEFSSNEYISQSLPHIKLSEHSIKQKIREFARRLKLLVISETTLTKRH